MSVFFTIIYVAEKALCKPCSAVAKIALYSNVVLSTNPKHSPIPTTVKEMNSVPFKTGTKIRFETGQSFICFDEAIFKPVAFSSDGIQGLILKVVYYFSSICLAQKSKQKKIPGSVSIGYGISCLFLVFYFLNLDKIRDFYQYLNKLSKI